LRLFAYRLAEKLGWVNVDDMLDEIEPGHLLEWLALQRITAEEEKRAELAARATSGVQGHRRRGR
jgi:mannose/cellobiose epimerase-like protein (N-acyl-D-glucosamine 2-epimerase family)